ncbi:hypothetical protein LTR22_009300 [Elasticomyces elasticus]|nr:hypothetical protein LTR22_009300 [Elasticomyces elasticus]
MSRFHLILAMIELSQSPIVTIASSDKRLDQPMPPPTPAVTLPAAADPAANPASTTIGLDPVDAANLAALATFATSITDRLSRDVHGNFFIKGSKTGKDTRHGELGELFSLVTRLEEFKTIVTKYIALLTPKEKEMAETEKVVSLNKNMKGVVEAMMEAKFGDKLRDLKVENQRLKEDVDKLKDAKTGGPGLVKVKENIRLLQADFGVLEKWRGKKEDIINELYQWAIDKDKADAKTSSSVRALEGWQSTMKTWKASIDSWMPTVDNWTSQMSSYITMAYVLLEDGSQANVEIDYTWV